MKVPGYEFPKSSFLSLEKDAGIIVRDMLANDRLKKLLFYEDRNCLNLPSLTQEQTLSLIDNQIRLYPKVEIDNNMCSYIIINFNNFLTNHSNPEYRDNLIIFSIACHYNAWNLGDYQLRPYKIAGELDSMFNEKNMFGIGKLKFMGAEQVIYNEEFSGLNLVYKSIHGNEDKIG